MNIQDHLSLRLTRLKSSEQVDLKGDALNFVFPKGGVGKFTSTKATHRLLPGDILIFNGAAGGKLEVFAGKSEFVFWNFSVCFDNLLPLFTSNEISLLHGLTENLKATKIHPASSPLAAECQRLLGLVPEQFNLDHRGQLIRIVASVLSVEFKDIQERRGVNGGAEDHMTRVFEKLSAAELINLSVGELADRFSCSRRHLNRLFHQHFGVSVASLRMEMRLLKAVALLRDADAKIINVAEQCGFNHLGLFNTCFKRRFGASPGQWRKSAIQVENLPLRKPQKNGHGQNHSAAAIGKLEGANPAVMSAFASKIAGGADILKDLQRRDLGFGTQASNGRRNPSQPRAGE